MTGFPEKIGLVGGHNIEHVTHFAFHPLRAEKVMAIVFEGIHAEAMESFSDPSFEHDLF